MLQNKHSNIQLPKFMYYLYRKQYSNLFKGTTANDGAGTAEVHS